MVFNRPFFSESTNVTKDKVVEKIFTQDVDIAILVPIPSCFVFGIIRLGNQINSILILFYYLLSLVRNKILACDFHLLLPFFVLFLTCTNVKTDIWFHLEFPRKIEKLVNFSKSSIHQKEQFSQCIWKCAQKYIVFI